jgi:hypothetical protein
MDPSNIRNLLNPLHSAFLCNRRLAGGLRTSYWLLVGISKTVA